MTDDLRERVLAAVRKGLATAPTHLDGKNGVRSVRLLIPLQKKV